MEPGGVGIDVTFAFVGVEALALGVGGAMDTGAAEIFAAAGLAVADGVGSAGVEPAHEANLRGPIAPPDQVPSLAGG